MKKWIIGASAAAAVAFGAGSAQAQEFDGPYAGVEAGWNRDDVGTIDTKAGSVALEDSRDSFTAGGYVGYDYRVSPKVVLGVEGNVGFGTSDKITRTGRDTIGEIDPKRSLSLTARAGYIVADHTLLYVRGGYSNVRVGATVTDASGTVSESSNRNAWLVGGGVERYLTPNISARLEYRYTDLSDGPGKYDRHQALVGVSYHF